MLNERSYVLPAVRPLPLNLKGKNWLSRLICWLTFRRQWELTEDYVFWCPLFERACMIPKGFTFDFASTPKIFYPLFNPTGFLLAGSIPHDFAYRHGGLLVIKEDRLRFTIVTRGEADEIFLSIGKSMGTAVIYRLAYNALRLFGQPAFQAKPYKEGMYGHS